METLNHRIPGIPLSEAGGLPPIRGELLAAVPMKADAPVQFDRMSAALGQVLRPQAAGRWMSPHLAAITPQYVESVLRGAVAGGHVQAWELFDLMCDTDPEIASCVGEYCDGILKKRVVFEPYHDEDAQPSPRALQKCKVVSAALRNMRPDPTCDENNLTRTIRDLLFSRFHGQSVLEMDWFDTYGDGKLNTIDVAGIGRIAAPRSTFWVHPACYGWDVEGRIGLRVDPAYLKSTTRDAKKKSLDTGYCQSRPTALAPIPPHKFLISVFKSKSGSPLAGSALRPLAWWWCASNFCGDWLLNLAQLFGIPFRKGKYAPGTDGETKEGIRAMLQNCGSAGYILLPDGADVEFIEAGTGTQQSPQAFLFEFADRQKRKVILRQTMTGSGQSSAGKGGLAGMSVEGDVKDQCLQAGANHACETLEQMGQAILAMNFGETSEAPTVRLTEESEGGLENAQRDQTLAAAGLTIGVNYLRKKYGIPEPGKDEGVIGGVSTAVPRFSEPMNAEARPAGTASLAAALSETLAPVANRVKAILDVTDETARTELLQKFLKDEEPKLRAAILHDTRLTDLISAKK